VQVSNFHPETIEERCLIKISGPQFVISKEKKEQEQCANQFEFIQIHTHKIPIFITSLLIHTKQSKISQCHCYEVPKIYQFGQN
jgi:hypothetical protein